MADAHNIRTRNPRNNLIGRRFGKLTVVSWAHNSRWLCLCDCGGQSKVLTANLNRGNTSSCGCVRNIASSKRATTHGLSNTRAYKTWLSVRRRCFETTNAAYKDYGAKGIGMDDEWAISAASFIRDVGQPPSGNYTLDRIDNAKGYFPGNVRWATPTEQANNKTNNRLVVFRGKTYTLAQLARDIAEEIGVTPRQMSSALEKEIYGRKRKRKEFPKS